MRPSFGNALWLRRLWSLMQPEGIPPQSTSLLSTVQIAQDRSWAGSREDGPLRHFTVSLAAGGAGTTNVVVLAANEGFRVLVRTIRCSGSAFLLAPGGGLISMATGTVTNWINDTGWNDGVTLEHAAVATGLVTALNPVTFTAGEPELGPLDTPGAPAVAELLPGEILVIADNNENGAFDATLLVQAVKIPT